MTQPPPITVPPQLSPLPYEPPPRKLRPGSMTALAIVSIVIASLSALTSAGSVLSGIGMLVLSRVQFPIPMPPTPMPPTTSAATTPATVPTMAFQFDLPALILTALGGLTGLIAAGVLLAAGIQVLRNRRIGRKLHWIFIAIKLPAILITAVATYLFSVSVLRNLTPAVPTGTTTPLFTDLMVWGQVGVNAVISLAYPITLMFLLRTRTAREYFASLTE